MSNILFQKVPTNEKGNILLDLEQISLIHNCIKNIIPKDYTLITSPMEIQKLDGDFKFVMIGCKIYTYNELMETIEKASMYDGLSK
jgi:hypothetical protein